jgi:type I restriction enzyme, S subunit
VKQERSQNGFVDFHRLFLIAPRNGIYKSKSFMGRGVKLVRMNELFGNRRIYAQNDSFARIELTQSEKDRLLLDDNDLLFSRTSVVADGVGLCSLVNVNTEHLTWDSNIIRIRLNPNYANPVFYFYFFNSPLGRGLVKSISSGVAVTTITSTGLSQLVVPHPSLEIQNRNAAILSAYDDLIENNTRRIQILEELARRIYDEWFVNFRFPGHENLKMMESEFGLIPQGWSAKRFGEIAQQVRRTVHPSEIEASTPYVGLEHIPRRSIALMEWDEAKDVQSMKHVFKAGNILFGKIRPYFHKVSVAPIDGICSTDAIVIEAKNREVFPFVLGTASSDAFVQYATQTSNGVNMPRANWSALLQYPVYIPTNTLIKRLSSFIEPVLAYIKNLTFKVRNLRQTRDLLLPKLTSGDIDVTNFPEPVSD